MRTWLFKQQQKCVNPAPPFIVFAMQDEATDDKAHSMNTYLINGYWIAILYDMKTHLRK